MAKSTRAGQSWREVRLIDLIQHILHPPSAHSPYPYTPPPCSFSRPSSKPWHTPFCMWASERASAHTSIKRRAGSSLGCSAGIWDRFWERSCTPCRRRGRTETRAWSGCRCRWGKWCAPPSACSVTAAAPAGGAVLSSPSSDCCLPLSGLREKVRFGHRHRIYVCTTV